MHLPVPVDAHTRKIFKMLDTNDDGTIDFREFVLGMLFAGSPDSASVAKKIELAFNIFDQVWDAAAVDEWMTLTRGRGVGRTAAAPSAGASSGACCTAWRPTAALKSLRHTHRFPFVLGDACSDRARGAGT
jgi:hypothetical protein